MRKAVLLCLLLSLPVFFFANQVLAASPAQQTVEVRDDEFEREVIARLRESRRRPCPSSGRQPRTGTRATLRPPEPVSRPCSSSPPVFTMPYAGLRW